MKRTFLITSIIMFGASYSFAQETKSDKPKESSPTKMVATTKAPVKGPRTAPETPPAATPASNTEYYVSVSRGQADSFSIFTYQHPEFFTRSKLPSRVQFNLTNNDTSFCTITLYKSQPSKTDVTKDVKRQWNEHIVKQLTKADKEPAQILTGQLWDGWTHTLAIGNFYQNKKKCVVMLNSFKKDKVTACTVYAFSDKSFKGPIELFSKEMHLKNIK